MFCPCRKRQPTALEKLVASTREQNVQAQGSDMPSSWQASFPMYTVHLDKFLRMTEVVAHEALLEADCLTEFDKSKGMAMFVSHQWLSLTHPDPQARQIRVLQDALRNILSGESRISVAVATELFYGRLHTPTSADLKSEPVFVWYDYFSCPQSPEKSQEQLKAISSIPVYVARCRYFVILAPALVHESQSETLGHRSWSQRGWCRAERMSRELAVEGVEDFQGLGFVIHVESAKHQSLLPGFTSFLYSPGEGRFTFEEDRAKIGSMMVQQLWSKIHSYLRRGDLHNYRFFLNQQSVRLNKLEISPVDPSVPDFQTDIDPFLDPDAFVLARFMHHNGFTSISRPDAGGWSPLCYAALNGDPRLVSALLAQRADPNDKLRKGKVEGHLPRNMSVLALAACFRNNEVITQLLSARAHVNATDARVHTALHWAGISDNTEGMRLLFDAGADHTIVAFPIGTCLQISCAAGSCKAVRECLVQVPDYSLQYCLHTSFTANPGSSDLVSLLLDLKADIDEPHAIPVSGPLWCVMSTMFRLNHYLRPSRLTSLLYHQHDATPLMFSLIVGSYEASCTLLERRASVDVRNCRGKTARDFAEEGAAPESVMQLLRQREYEEMGGVSQKSGAHFRRDRSSSSDLVPEYGGLEVVKEEAPQEDTEEEMVSVYVVRSVSGREVEPEEEPVEAEAEVEKEAQSNDEGSDETISVQF